MKYGRTYVMTVEGNQSDHTIKFPLTCRFQITGSNLLNSGEALFQIYNLGIETRSDIYRDALDFVKKYKQVKFWAGYMGENNLSQIFQGNILQAYSYRQGPDWITEIWAVDGGHAKETTSVNLTLSADYQYLSLFTQLLQAMKPTVLTGTISTSGLLDQNNKRGITFCGAPWDLIGRYISPYNMKAFIDKEKAYIVNNYEYILHSGEPIAIPEISASVGMIGSPRMQQNIVCVKTIFEPRYRPQQLIELKVIEPRMSGPYIVQEVKHGGTISGAVCETLYTDVTLYRPILPIRQAA